MFFFTKKLVKKLSEKKMTISVAESCTGGLLSFSLAKIPGVSKVYSLGLTTYSNKSKNKLLNVPNHILTKYGAVSKKVCVLMVKNLNKIAKTDISISITGIAGPTGATILKPIGLIYVGIKIKKRTICKKIFIKSKSRSFIQKECVKKTLKMLYKLI